MEPNLPILDFLKALQQEFKYSLSIEKYKLWLQVMLDDQYKNKTRFIALCKVLFLQNYQHEARFEELLEQYFSREVELLQPKLQTDTEDSPQLDVGDTGQKENDAPVDNVSIPDLPDNPDEPAPVPEFVTSQDQSGSTTYYVNLPDITTTLTAPKSATRMKLNFLHSDEYFPVTRRQMIKGWQFLRRQEKGGINDDIDIRATISEIAKEGFFTKLSFNPAVINRQDAVLFFCDYRGSMTPFHELIDRLVATAKKDGGHPQAPVYYFQNAPRGFVFRKSNMTGAVKIKETLARTNKNFTVAIVISDAGALRGNKEATRVNSRVSATMPFIRELNKACGHVIWLNPVPAHRWPQTAAEVISKKVFVMAPIMEDNYSFQETLRTIFKSELVRKL